MKINDEYQSLAEELRKSVSGEVRFDHYSRVLYSTDASIYQMEPIGVVIPRNTDDVVATMSLANKNGVPVLPRGGGTSLSGQTVGKAVVMDFSKYMNEVLEVNPEERWVRTQPGITLDGLNARLKPYGLHFAPDPTTSSRGNVGGALGNNSCGAHSILFGKTVDNVLSIEAVLSNADLASFGPTSREELSSKLRGDGFEAEIYGRILDVAQANREEVDRRFPKIQRRVSGYNLDELLTDGESNLARFLVGSEGTLAAITEARLKLEPLPKKKALAVLHFEDVVESMEATVEVLKEDPSAVEMVDKLILDMAKGSLGYSSKLTFVDGDPAALLLVEFFGDSESELESRLQSLESRMARSRLGYSAKRLLSPADQANVWAVRKAGLGLLMGMKGDVKPLPFVEDTAVSPERLPDYVRRFDEVVRANGTSAGYYGHASVGCLHVRPLIDLKLQEGVDRMVSIADQISDLVLEFGGSLSGEHGDGIVRGVWNEKMFGATLYNAFREVKKAFDPKGIMNPGKIVDCPPMTENLRYGPSYKTLEMRNTFDFSADGGFSGAIEMCNGVGACRKPTGGTMCPSYMATREEKHSTRGRANALRAAISGMLPEGELGSRRMFDVLDLCLECKACKSECPSNVDMAKLKYEFLNRYHGEHGLPFRSRFFGDVALFSALGSFFAPLSNWAIRSGLGKRMLDEWLEIDGRRDLPTFASQTFVQWFRARAPANREASSETVILFHDTFTNYNYPHVGIAATKVLEKLGFRVRLAEVKCCGRPMMSKGMLDKARRYAMHNVETLHRYAKQGVRVVGLEPSCLLAFRDDYPDLLPAQAKQKAKLVAQNAFLLEEFVQSLDRSKNLKVQFKDVDRKMLVHGHCHQKSLVGNGPTLETLGLVPGLDIHELDAGCCGMAGAFGFEKEHYEVSMSVGEQRLFPAVRSQSGDFDVVTSGVSCRQQIEHATGKRARHLAEVLLEAMA